MAMYTMNQEIEKIAEIKNITLEEVVKTSNADISKNGEEYYVSNRRNQNELLAELAEAKENAERQARRIERLSTFHWIKEEGNWVVAGNFEGKKVNDIIKVVKASGEKQDKIIVDFTGKRNAIVK